MSPRFGSLQTTHCFHLIRRSYLVQLPAPSKSSHMCLLNEWMAALLHTIFPLSGTLNKFITCFWVSESHFLCEIASPHSPSLGETHSSALPWQSVRIPCSMYLQVPFEVVWHLVPLWQRLPYSSTGSQDLKGWLTHGGYSVYMQPVHGAVSSGGGGRGKNMK